MGRGVGVDREAQGLAGGDPEPDLSGVAVPFALRYPDARRLDAGHRRLPSMVAGWEGEDRASGEAVIGTGAPRVDVPIGPGGRRAVAADPNGLSPVGVEGVHEACLARLTGVEHVDAKPHDEQGQAYYDGRHRDEVGAA